VAPTRSDCVTRERMAVGTQPAGQQPQIRSPLLREKGRSWRVRVVTNPGEVWDSFFLGYREDARRRRCSLRRRRWASERLRLRRTLGFS
jgi:hypothetical protein